MKDKFNTPLTADEALAFHDWLKRISQAQGRDVSRDLENYDMQGYFKSYGSLPVGKGHFTDRYKKPNHPTFSEESLYHGVKDEQGVPYMGGKWGKNSFTPSDRMLYDTHGSHMLQDYFRRFEPGVQLILPNPK